jgi:UDP-N-acetylglucosamine--N-acetylmuramyl-(pentapeptide) pyrophosphoryl-undecaprenol N-acetylglucosamine transferase
MKEKRILFTGGGTAGHVIVNLALIPHFQKEGWGMDYIGSKTGIERGLIEGTPNVTYHAISTGKLRRYMSMENIKDPFKVIKGTWDAWRMIGKVKPDVIFSKGGFVSVPVVVAARLRRVPTIIHESDLTPGLANKLAIPFVKKVFTTFRETVAVLPEKKAEHVGAIIREELFTGDQVRGNKLIGKVSNKPVLLIMGGSIGSQKINGMIRENLDTLLRQFHIVHICGRDNVDHQIEKNGYTQFEYVNEELKDLFAITDYVISRAGANAIFEFLALGLPMLLIPLSKAASRGDQIDNAKSFQKQGIAEMVLEEDLTSENLLASFNTLVENSSQLKVNMKKHSSRTSREKAIAIIEAMAKSK